MKLLNVLRLKNLDEDTQIPANMLPVVFIKAIAVRIYLEDKADNILPFDDFSNAEK